MRWQDEWNKVGEDTFVSKDYKMSFTEKMQDFIEALKNVFVVLFLLSPLAGIAVFVFIMLMG